MKSAHSPKIILPLVLLIFCFGYGAKAQEEGRFRFSLLGERTQYNNRITQEYGLALEYYVSDWVSLSYMFSLGKNSENEIYGHIPTGAWLAAYPFTIYINTNDDFYLYLTILALGLPEMINFHIRVSESFQISPFIAPFGMYYEESPTDSRGSFQSGYGAGLRFNVFKDNLAVSPYLGIRSLYQRGSSIGILAGLTVGLSFE